MWKIVDRWIQNTRQLRMYCEGNHPITFFIVILTEAYHLQPQTVFLMEFES